jgi:hypothetical protein
MEKIFPIFVKIWQTFSKILSQMEALYLRASPWKYVKALVRLVIILYVVVAILPTHNDMVG